MFYVMFFYGLRFVNICSAVIDAAAVKALGF